MTDGAGVTIPLRKKIEIPRIDVDAERKRLLDQFDAADIQAMVVVGAKLLVAKWVREKEGSFAIPASMKKEDEYQGKVGLVLKIGPLAFENDDRHDWCGQRADPGDWVMYGYSDGYDFDYRMPGTFDRVPCKIIDESHIQAVLPRPDFAY